MTDHDRLMVMELYSAGEKLKVIGAALPHLPPGTIAHILYKARLAGLVGRRHPPKASTKDGRVWLEAVARGVVRGMTWRAIAADIGMHPSSLCRFVAVNRTAFDMAMTEVVHQRELERMYRIKALQESALTLPETEAWLRKIVGAWDAWLARPPSG